MAPLYVRSTRRAAPARVQPAASAASPAFGLPAPPPGIVQRPAGISLCMIVKDEERFLEACLRSAAPFVDEICIVDTGSTDRTLEIAAAFGARIEHRPWRNDFAWARNEALAMATKRWIFVLDADEELDAPCAQTLRGLRDVPAHLTGIWVRCQNLSDDYKGTGVASHALVRMFPNSPRIRYQSPIHEFISIDKSPTGIEAKMSTISITHHGYLSEIVKLRKKSERNLALVTAATIADPSDPFNWYNLGTTSLLAGDRKAAIAALEKMRVIVGESQRGFVPNALSSLADLYTDEGECDRAIEIAQESLRKAPHFANAHFALGRALAKAKRYPEARAAFEGAIADREHAARQFIVDDEVSTWKAHSEIGSAFGHEGNDAAALEWFERALVERPNVVPVRMNRARALERLGRFGEAEAAFASLANDEPGDAHSVDHINYLLRRNDHLGARTAIENALRFVTPRTQASLLVVAARIAAQTGSEAPELLLRRALAAHSGAADALEALEALYRARGDGPALDQLLRDELAAPMTAAPDYARRGARHLQAGTLDVAEEVTRAGLQIAPSDPALRYNLGAVMVQSARKEAAVDELRLACGGGGDVALRARFLLAVVLGDLGRPAEALDHIEAVIALAPAEVDARLHRFRLLLALDRASEAEAGLREALALGDSRVTVELATWLLRMGRFTEAGALADRALDRSQGPIASNFMPFLPTSNSGMTALAPLARSL